MKNGTKKIFYMGIVVAVLIGIIFLFINKNFAVENYKSKNEIRIDDIIDTIVSCEFDDYNSNHYEELKSEIEQMLENSSEEDNLAEINFILGYIDVKNSEDKSAEQKFNRAISCFKNDTNPLLKARTYYELSVIYLYKEENEESDEAYEKLIKLLESQNLQDEIVYFNVKRTYDLYSISRGMEKPIELIENTLELAKEINYKEMQEVYFRLGVVYWYADRVVEATNYKLEAMNIAQERNLEKDILDISTDLGIDFLFLGNHEEAVKYLKLALNYTLEDPYEEADSKSYTLLNLMDAYMQLGEYEAAQEALESAQQYINQLKDGGDKEDTLTSMYVNKADLQTRLGNTSESLELLNLATERFNAKERFLYYHFDIKLAQEYGDVYYALGDYESALKYHKEAERLSEESQVSYHEIFNNENLYLDYKALNDYENTIKYLEKNNNLNRNLRNNQDSQYSQYLLNKFESEKNLEKISNLELAQNTMKNLIMLSVIIIIIILYCSVFSYKKNKEIKRLNKLFKDLSITDGLTNIPNRRALDEYLSENWAEYNNTNKNVSFVMIDIDCFKGYNDNYGHPEGDKVLKSIANCIKESCSNYDFVARYGGEEFAIIMMDTEKNKAIEKVEKLRENLFNLNINHGYSCVSDRITLSIGVCTTYLDNTNTPYDKFIEKADNALYKAKENGRNRYEYLD